MIWCRKDERRLQAGEKQRISGQARRQLTTNSPRTLVWVALASFLVTLPHSFEDFVEGVPQEFGVGVLVGGVLLAIFYAVHALGIVLASHERKAGYAINLLAGTGWFFGALFDHLPDVLSFEPYRTGFPSKLLEVLVMGFGLALIFLSGRLLLARRRRPVR